MNVSENCQLFKMLKTLPFNKRLQNSRNTEIEKVITYMKD